jgi:hypothetical protein
MSIGFDGLSCYTLGPGSEEIPAQMNGFHLYLPGRSAEVPPTQAGVFICWRTDNHGKLQALAKEALAAHAGLTTLLLTVKNGYSHEREVTFIDYSIEGSEYLIDSFEESLSKTLHDAGLLLSS